MTHKANQTDRQWKRFLLSIAYYRLNLLISGFGRVKDASIRSQSSCMQSIYSIFGTNIKIECHSCLINKINRCMSLSFIKYHPLKSACKHHISLVPHLVSCSPVFESSHFKKKNLRYKLEVLGLKEVGKVTDRPTCQHCYT